MHDYSGMSFTELLELDFVTYKRLFADAYIYKLKQTETGRKHLEDCYIAMQTEPDREALRKFINRK